MKENTESQTLWSQSMFDSLFAALARGGDDASIRELISDLENKGYTLDTLAAKANKAHGPAAAARLMKIGGRTPATTAAAPARRRYRVSRTKRLRNWLRDGIDNIEDAFERLRAAFGRS